MSFAGAPVSKAFILTLGVTSLVAAAISKQYFFDIPLTPNLTRDKQLYRFILHHFAFINSSELFVGILVLFYSSNPLERTFGSRKFASFLLATTFLITVLEILSLLILPSLGFGLTKLPAGPFGIIAAIVYQNFRVTPCTFSYRIFGLEISNRVTFYLLTLQLFSSQPPLTLLPTFLGFLSSYLYRSNFLSLLSFRVSPRIVLLFYRLYSPILNLQNPQPPRRSNNADFTLPPGPSGSAFARVTGIGGSETIPIVIGGGSTANNAEAGVGIGGGESRLNTNSPVRTASGNNAGSGGGLMREWTDGITAGGGVRQPTAQQITELSAIFPNIPRDRILAALQINPDVQRAAETLLIVPP